MAQGSSLTLTRIIAVLLLCLVGQRGWELSRLRGHDSHLEELQNLEDSALSSSDLADRLDAFRAAASGLSDSQEQRLQALNTRVERRMLDASLSLMWTDGGHVPLGQVSSGRATIGLGTQKTISVGFHGGEAPHAMLSQTEIDGKALRETGFTIPLDIRPGTDGNAQHTIIAALPDGNRREYELLFRQDEQAPQVKFQVPGRGGVTVDSADGRLGLKSGETVDLIIQDETLLRQVVITDLAAKKHTDFRNRSSVRQSLKLTEPATPVPYLVEAEDWAGNRVRFAFNLGRWRRPLPVIRSLAAGGHDLLRAAGHTNKDTIDIDLTFEGEESERRVVVQAGGKEHPLTGDGSHMRARGVPLGPERHWRGTIVLKQIDRDVELAKIAVRSDRESPRISLLDDQGEPILMDVVEVKKDARLVLKIEDDDGLDKKATEAKTEGELRIPSRRPARSGITYKLTVEGAGKLDVRATDLAGNVSTRTINFSLIAAVGPDDGRGPDITLKDSTGREIPVEESVFFWNKSPHVSLNVSDASGLDAASMKFEHCRTVGKADMNTTSYSGGLELDNDPVISVKDVYGRITRRAYRIQIVRGDATLALLPEQGTIKSLPLSLRWRTPEVVPAGLLSIALIDPKGTRHKLDTSGEGSNSLVVIKTLPNTLKGKWKAELLFHAFDGIKTIATKEFSVALNE